jgi:hypothetical protein
MANYVLRLHYDGLGAADGKMPTSFEKQITTGAQMFLGAHAYYHTERRIPNAVMDHSRHFQVHDVRYQRGSWEALYEVSFAGLVVRELLIDAVKDTAKGVAKDAFKTLVQQSYVAWKNRRILVGSSFDNSQITLDAPGPSNTPIFDFSAEDEMQRKRLFERIDQSVSLMSSPIGTAAGNFEIWLDEYRLDRIERRIYTDQEIVDALRPLQARLSGGRRH